jgi:nicotinamide-nucleotide amidase
MNTNDQAVLRDQILDFSRQKNIGLLSPWLARRLDEQINTGWFLPVHDLELIARKITHWLTSYRIQTSRAADKTMTVVLGMSGGVDSALTAAFFKRAGYRVIGVTMPIHQNPEETERGIEACRALGIEHLHVDLSDLYDATLAAQSVLDPDLIEKTFPAGVDFDELRGDLKVKIRRGNFRARLRMVTLYNLANLHGGFVASTDNFSELLTGFWTLHGDVGDVSPIQSMLKSWEVPYLAMLMGVPETTYRAVPTDGLGIAAGDEAQFGCTYLELDIMFGAIASEMHLILGRLTEDELYDRLGIDADPEAPRVFNSVVGRIKGSWFKRQNPINVEHPLRPRLDLIAEADALLAMPKILTEALR